MSGEKKIEINRTRIYDRVLFPAKLYHSIYTIDKFRIITEGYYSLGNIVGDIIYVADSKTHCYYMFEDTVRVATSIFYRPDMKHEKSYITIEAYLN